MKNSLADIHPELVSEWSESNLPLTPDTVTYGSNKEVWWKGKISERAIDGKGCRECEKEYQGVFPQLAVGYYAAKKGLKVLFHSDTALGIPLEIYIPEEKVAVESFEGTKEMEGVKRYVCKQKGIKLVKIIYRTNDNEIEFAYKIKRLFQSIHIFISSDVEEDVMAIREHFYKWRKRQI